MVDDTWMELPVPSEVCRRLGPIIPTSRRWAAWSSETSSGEAQDHLVDAALQQIVKFDKKAREILRDQ
jgi:hypothetical protein